MSNLITRAVWRSIAVLGGHRAARSLTQGTPRVLAYHRLAAANGPREVGVATFREQMLLLKRRFNVIAIDDLTAALRARRPLPRCAVVLTFDDGYEDFYRYAFPVLQELSLPATLYVPTQFVAGVLWLWPDRLRWALAHSAAAVVRFAVPGQERLQQLPLDTAAQRAAAWGVLADSALLLPATRRDEFIAQIECSLQVHVPPQPTAAFRAVSWQQLAHMHAAGLTVGSHTRSHVRLAMESRERQWQEIEQSKREIEAQLDTTVRHFCYPHGGRTDYTDETRSLVQAAGYESAMVAFADGSVTQDIYALRRYTVAASFRDFEHAIYGWKHLRARLQARAQAVS